MVALEVALGVVIGFIVGLLGGGGAVLTVPVLVFVVGMPASEATTVSLVVVAVASAVGVLGHGRASRVDWRRGTLLGGLGIVGTVVGARLALLVAAEWLLVGFSGLLLASGTAMVRPQRAVAGRAGPDDRVRRRLRLLAVASGIGFVTGFLGVGGGFLVVPALVLFLRLPMARAVGTSLLVIIVNSLVALASRYGADVDWTVATAVAGGAGVGSVVGVIVSGRVPGPVLRRLFGGVVLAVGIVMLADAVRRFAGG